MTLPHTAIPTFRYSKLGVLGASGSQGPFQRLVRSGLRGAVGEGSPRGELPRVHLWLSSWERLSVCLCLSLVLCISLDLSLSCLTLHSPVSCPHVCWALRPAGFLLQLSASISGSLSPPARPLLLCFVYLLCVFPSRSERLGHREVFPLGECPASGPGGARPSLGVDLASCRPGPLEAVLPGLGKAGVGSVRSQAPAGPG